MMITIAGLLAADISQAKEYFIYGDKKNGTKFREVVYRWPVPLMKRFSKLKPKHQSLVIDSQTNLEPGNLPPYPKQGVGAILKPYVEYFRWYGESTVGTLTIDVDESGTVQIVRGSAGMRTDVVRHMAGVIHDLEFDPAVCSGNPCSNTFTLELLEIKNPKYEKGL